MRIVDIEYRIFDCTYFQGYYYFGCLVKHRSRTVPKLFSLTPAGDLEPIELPFPESVNSWFFRIFNGKIYLNTFAPTIMMNDGNSKTPHQFITVDSNSLGYYGGWWGNWTIYSISFQENHVICLKSQLDEERNDGLKFALYAFIAPKFMKAYDGLLKNDVLIYNKKTQVYRVLHCPFELDKVILADDEQTFIGVMWNPGKICIFDLLDL